jgi:hypothetical protein
MDVIVRSRLEPRIRPIIDIQISEFGYGQTLPSAPETSNERRPKKSPKKAKGTMEIQAFMLQRENGREGHD